MNEVDTYIATFPSEVQPLLQSIRTTIREAAPLATETFVYGMPAYKLNGKPLVYFAGFKKHIGFYAIPKTHQQFSEQLTHYKQGKGSVQFPINQALPLLLIKQMVEYRVTELS